MLMRFLDIAELAKLVAKRFEQPGLQSCARTPIRGLISLAELACLKSQQQQRTDRKTRRERIVECQTFGVGFRSKGNAVPRV